MNEKDLLRKLAGLPREIEPEHDPWSEISARIGTQEEVRSSVSAGQKARVWYTSWPVRAVAALAVMAVALALVSGPQTTPIIDRSGLAVADPTGAPLMAAMLAGSEAEYQAAFREFIAIGESRDRMPTAEIEKIESGWAHLLQAEVALADALVQNPGDPFLNRKMLDLRARQLGFLRQMAAIDHSNRRMTI